MSNFYFLFLINPILLSISLISHDDESDERLTSKEIITRKNLKINAKEEAQMIRARAFLNRLDTKVQEKDEIVKQIRYIFYCNAICLY